MRTAKPANLIDRSWAVNGVGRPVSHSFGYGLMDAAAMVKVARTWKPVPEQQRCEINAPPLDKYVFVFFVVLKEKSLQFHAFNFLDM